jgi:hypothetical protein
MNEYVREVQLNCRCAAPGTTLRCNANDEPGLCSTLCDRLRADNLARVREDKKYSGFLREGS